jgi:hypothetical protein
MLKPSLGHPSKANELEQMCSQAKRTWQRLDTRVEDFRKQLIEDQSSAAANLVELMNSTVHTVVGVLEHTLIDTELYVPDEPGGLVSMEGVASLLLLDTSLCPQDACVWTLPLSAGRLCVLH